MTTHKDEMTHPKSERVLNIQAGLKAGGCPQESLDEATIEALIDEDKLKSDDEHCDHEPDWNTLSFMNGKIWVNCIYCGEEGCLGDVFKLDKLVDWD